MEPLTAGLELAGRFRLVRALGRGGMGEVWLAEEIPGARRVAVKFPAPDALESLRAGFDQASRLVHPSIVALHEFVDRPRPFLVMQLVEGGDIGELRGADFRTILAALLPVAEALEYAHRQGVVHRDLKPANILRDAQGRCFITDFGTTRGGGSLPGMSPQHLDGEAPTVSDDIYGFGALLYELIAGAPLFHPQVTPERIRDAAPALPVADLNGAVLPAPLRRLLGAMLAKSPSRRPAGMAAVRDALDEVLREASESPLAAASAAIQPVRRRRQAGADASEPGLRAARVPPPRAGRSGLPASLVYGAAAVLAIVAGVVVFYLPTFVRERGPPVGAIPAPAPETARPAPSAAIEVPQAALDAALGEFLQLDDELRKVNADRWGGAQWAELRRVADQSDAAYRARDAAAALAGYRVAAGQAQALLARAPEVLAEALRAGEAALTAGNQAQAIAAFETALAVAPGDDAAARGLERAKSLDRLLALMREAGAAEAAGERATALALYRQAVALDPRWGAAGEGVARLEAASARDAFQAQMARGFAAQVSGDLAAARDAFAAALRQRPGDLQAQAALAQVEADRQLERLASLQSEALDFERKERWNDAASRYEAALALDSNLAEARQALERARARAALDARLRRELGNADRFNDDAALGKARAVLESARAVTEPGPVLAGQIAELDRLLQLAVIPVQVTFESDNLTEVTVFKVGRLGAFSSRSLALRPGAYTVVGSRTGYRDVRRNFRVAPGEPAAPVVVRCEEPI